jgi:geranyl-CoA carboxylase beta subunit
MGLTKALRAQALALETQRPLIALVESGGANLMYQSEIFVEGGRSFANQARMSAAGIPQISVVHGSSTAGGAYLPGLSDYVVLVRGRSSICLAGAPLVKAAIGEAAGIDGLASWKRNKGSARTDWEAVAKAAGAPEELVQKFTSTHPGARVLRLSKEK